MKFVGESVARPIAPIAEGQIRSNVRDSKSNLSFCLLLLNSVGHMQRLATILPALLKL